MDTPNPVVLSVRKFGVIKSSTPGEEDETVWEYVWTNSSTKTTVKVISYGAIIRVIEVPDKNGATADIVLGFDTLEEYYSPRNRYFGAVVGRVANRTANGTFELNGTQFTLAKNNNGLHHLHGGTKGFDKYNWSGHVEGNAVILSHVSPDKNEGYPGDLLVQIRYELTKCNAFKSQISAMTTKSTPINMTNHSYFNLAGHDACSEKLFQHWVTINADRITEMTNSIPNGKLISVSNTAFDLRVHQELGKAINKLENGYDNNFCVTKGVKQELNFVSRVTHPPSGRFFEVYSDQPGVQFYTANFLPNPDKNEDDLLGKNRKPYRRQGSFCLETQKYPDSLHHSNFPSIILKPGETYKHVCIYRFGVGN